MIHHNNRERTLAFRNLHHARDGQPITGIVNQVRGIFIRFGQRFEDANVPALVVMLAQSLDGVGIDQFFGCGSRRRERRFRWKRNRRDGFDDNLRRREGLGWERLRGLAGGEEEKKEVNSLSHRLIVSTYVLKTVARRDIHGCHYLFPF